MAQPGVDSARAAERPRAGLTNLGLATPAWMGDVAAAIPDARRVRIPDREHINVFLASEIAVPRIEAFLAAAGR